MKSNKRAKSIDFQPKGIPIEILRELYRTMLMIQKVELKIAEFYPQDEMKTPVHLCLGQEAIAAGFCSNLNKDDYIFSNHRGHGHYLAKGGNLNAMVAELYNRETGCSRGRGGSMHLIDTSVGVLGTSSIVGGCIPLATGAALGSALRKEKRVSIAFFGDAAVEEGVIYESINFAMLKRLPVVYVCENNFYSVFSHLSKRQPNDEIYRRFEGFSIPSYRIDGNNVVEIYHAAKEAIGNARMGRGPSFIECRTYRIRDHHGSGSGVEVGYRTQQEVDKWAVKCPVKNYECFILQEHIMTITELKTLATTIDQEVEDVFRFAQASPVPNGDDIPKYLYQ